MVVVMVLEEVGKLWIEEAPVIYLGLSGVSIVKQTPLRGNVTSTTYMPPSYLARC